LVRLPTPPAHYSPQEEAGFRRVLSEELARNEFPEIRIGGGVLYGENGALKFKSQAGTITVLAAL
jgi:hypothetical protein